MRRALVVVLAAAAFSPARADPMPVVLDAMGPIVDVTLDAGSYQPASSFCVDIDGFDGYTAFSGDPGPTCEGTDDLLVEIDTPSLCGGCRRLFIDYAQIGENDPAAGILYAHGHVFFRLHAWNPGYTAEPIAHSPNIKNVTNDKAFAPEGSPQEAFASAIDLHAISYVGSTAKHTHSDVQGPYYVGPTYVNVDGETIRGAYVDVDVTAYGSTGNPSADEIRYWVGYNAGEATCPDNVLFDGEYADGNYGYYGCAAHPAVSETAYQPYPPS